MRVSNAPVRQKSRSATRSPIRRVRTTMSRYLAPTGETTGSTNAERSRLIVMMTFSRTETETETEAILKTVSFFMWGLQKDTN